MTKTSWAVAAAALVAGTSTTSGGADDARVTSLAPDARHQLVVFFAEGREPLTTLDLPITSEVGEVGAQNLYIPGDVDLLRTFEALGWSAIRRSRRWGNDGGYVVSFACDCGRGVWWQPLAARRLSRSPSIDSVRVMERDASGSFFAGEYIPSMLETVRPDVPDSLTGTVWVRVAIDTCGVVVESRVERTTMPPVFDEAALAAARRWRFFPANCEATWARRPSTERIAAEIVIPFRFEE